MPPVLGGRSCPSQQGCSPAPLGSAALITGDVLVKSHRCNISPILVLPPTCQHF